MRTNQNPSISSNRATGGKLGMPQMPAGWLDSGSWRLPSGKALAEFALQSGFLAPLLFRGGGFGSNAAEARPALEDASEPQKNLGEGEDQ